MPPARPCAIPSASRASVGCRSARAMPHRSNPHSRARAITVSRVSTGHRHLTSCIDPRTFGPSDPRTLGPSDLRTFGPSDPGTLLPCEPSEHVRQDAAVPERGQLLGRVHVHAGAELAHRPV